MLPSRPSISRVPTLRYYKHRSSKIYTHSSIYTYIHTHIYSYIYIYTNPIYLASPLWGLTPAAFATQAGAGEWGCLSPRSPYETVGLD